MVKHGTLVRSDLAPQRNKQRAPLRFLLLTLFAVYSFSSKTKVRRLRMVPPLRFFLPFYSSFPLSILFF
jgi:hypothetical protein